MILYWGNTKNLLVKITEGGQPKNCTGFNCSMVIKEKDLRTAPLVLKIDITWTNSGNGEGTFYISSFNSSSLSVKTYFIEIILYKEDGSFKKTLYKDKLIVKQSLGLT